MAEKIDISLLLDNMVERINSHCDTRALKNPLMIGIQRGGVWIASQLHRKLALKDPLGELNIAFYRDDFSKIGIHPEVRPSKLSTNLNDRHVILVDDVLHTGRTIRAAMNEIFDYGRPASIILAILIERSGRELPVHANIIGKTITLKDGEHVKLSGPEPLALEIKKTG
jgi:pyrimidine operon attenuation protein/uracil phosphoribosyltransferase|tara:strand:+ start:6169 stop:6675 length:507 start_codon:yes stop_codon:yes gene_type:complete